MMDPEQPTPCAPNEARHDNTPDAPPIVSAANTKDAQTDIGSQFTAEFNAGCAKQSQREAVMDDIIARIAAGESAMIVFCEEEHVGEFAAFRLGARAGKLCVEEYD